MGSRFTVLLALAVTVLLTACGSPGLRGPSANEVADMKDKRILVMDPFIRSFEVGLGQQKFRRVDVEKKVRSDVTKAFDAVAQDTKWFKTVPFPELSDELMAEYEQRAALFQVSADTYLTMKEVGGTAWEPLSKDFRANIGTSSAMRDAAQRTNTRFGVLFVGVEMRTSALAKGVGVIANAVTFGQSSLKVNGTMHTLMGVLDFQTGDVVWLLYEKDSGDLGSVSAISSVIKKMLDGSPLSGAKS